MAAATAAGETRWGKARLGFFYFLNLFEIHFTQIVPKLSIYIKTAFVLYLHFEPCTLRCYINLLNKSCYLWIIFILHPHSLELYYFNKPLNHGVSLFDQNE